MQNLSYQRTTPIPLHGGGYSLVEMLVYLAVLILVMFAGVTTYLSLDTVIVRNQTERTLTSSAQMSFERVVHEIRTAEAVNTGASTFGVSPGVLVLTNGATTTTFSISGSRLIVSRDGTEIGPLTSDDVVVEDMTFTRYAGAVTDMIRVSLTLSANSKSASTTRTYYMSAVLREGYE